MYQNDGQDHEYYQYRVSYMHYICHSVLTRKRECAIMSRYARTGNRIEAREP